MDKREKIHKILDLVLDINGLENRERSITGDLPTAFFKFSGHVSHVEAVIYPKGWEPDCNADITFSLYTDRKTADVDSVIDALERLKDELQV